MLRTETITGQTAAGRPARITIEVTEPDPVDPPLVVGANVDPTQRAHLGPGGRLAGARITRTFCGPGQGILPWGHPRRFVPDPVCEHLSFKDWPSDAAALAALGRLLDTAPAHLFDGPPLLPELRIYDPDGYTPDDAPDCDGLSLLVTCHHEHEPDFIAAGLSVRECRRRHRLVYATIRQHPRGHRVGVVPIQTGTWTEATTTATSGPKGDGDPLAWWPGVGDYVGWDGYALSNTTARAAARLYRTPEALVEVPLLLAAGTGRRLLLAEVAVIRQGNPPDPGELRAAFIRAFVPYLRRRNVAAVSWWDAAGSNDRDFRLSDPPSLAAWQDAIAGRI